MCQEREQSAGLGRREGQECTWARACEQRRGAGARVPEVAGASWVLGAQRDWSGRRALWLLEGCFGVGCGSKHKNIDLCFHAEKKKKKKKDSYPRLASHS